MKSSLGRSVLLLIVVGALGGCAGNSDINPNAPYISAHTGTVASVDGVDIWQDQQPNRPYRVITTIQDSRTDDLTPQLTIWHVLAQRAKKAGGDGLIIVSMKSQDMGGQLNTPNRTPYTGFDPNPTINGSKTVTKAQVIVYTDKTPAAPAKPTAP